MPVAPQIFIHGTLNSSAKLSLELIQCALADYHVHHEAFGILRIRCRFHHSCVFVQPSHFWTAAGHSHLKFSSPGGGQYLLLDVI